MTLNYLELVRKSRILQAVVAVDNDDFSTWQHHAERAVAGHAEDKTPEEVARRAVGHLFNLDKSVPFDAFQKMLGGVLGPYCGLHAWALNNFPHFVLSPDFFHAVSVTDYQDNADEPLHMPFDSFVISFPKSTIFKENTRAFIFKVPNVVLDNNIADPAKRVVVKFPKFCVFLCPERIYSTWDVASTKAQIYSLPNPTSEETGLEEDEIWRTQKMIQLLGNVMSYIEASGPLPEKRKGKHDAPQPVERDHDKRRLYNVGRPVKLDGNIRKAIQERGSDGASWKLAQRFIVRGHWKNQAYGEGRSLRRRTWIQPFWKGPENVVEAMKRTYEVKFDETAL